MAYNPKPVLAFLLILNILLAISGPTLAGVTPQITLKKQTQNSLNRSSVGIKSVLIPGFGHYMIPKRGSTSTHSPTIRSTVPAEEPAALAAAGLVAPAPAEESEALAAPGAAAADLVAGNPHNYIPVGDDTFIPNPGVNVPNPGLCPWLIGLSRFS
ncbi:uncharacterized protein LOC130774251 [Actinidia eriantha]|uniref:uncharacterized protein LOC130774251 n=1 Tax=Actinidia eriantha TaxID=165200 RepID=UPI00258512B5|nr:uncharacterized protein LOC130774251 [Actinidia eriantha]